MRQSVFIDGFSFKTNPFWLGFPLPPLQIPGFFHRPEIWCVGDAQLGGSQGSHWKEWTNLLLPLVGASWSAPWRRRQELTMWMGNEDGYHDAYITYAYYICIFWRIVLLDTWIFQSRFIIIVMFWRELSSCVATEAHHILREIQRPEQQITAESWFKFSTCLGHAWTTLVFQHFAV